MTKLTYFFTVLFCACTIMSANAQIMVFEAINPSPPNNESDEQGAKNTVLTYNGNSVIIYFGAFDELPGVPGSANLYFLDSQRISHAFAGAKNFSEVFTVTLDYDGEILAGTNNGMYKLTGSNWMEMYGTQGHAIRMIEKSLTGKLFFTKETAYANPDFAPKTEFIYFDGEEEFVLFETDGLATGYVELDTIGIVTFKDGGLGTFVPSFAFNVNTMQQIVGFKPPHEDEWFLPTGGYFSTIATTEKLYFSASGVGIIQYLISWDGNVWSEDEFRFPGIPYVINDELYCGGYRINPADLTLEPVAVIGDQMAWGRLTFFDNTWYILSPTLDEIPIGPATADMDEFGWNISSYVPSCIARIGTTTSIDQLQNDHLTIFPNPTHDVLNIEGISTVDNISMYDIAGTLVLTATTKVINVSEVPAGVYLLSIGTGEKIFNAPIIIER